MRTVVGRDNTYYIHVTLLPHIGATGELKTKPTQHSVRELRATGIQPDAIVCRSDFDIPEDVKDKIALFCDVRRDAVIPMLTVNNIYEVPLVLEESGIGDLVIDALDLNAGPRNLGDWRKLVDRMANTKKALPIAVVGKYADLPDAYLSVKEALRHAGVFHDRDVDISWVQSEDIERDGADEWLDHVAGIVVPGGFGARGVEGMIDAVAYAREQRVPYLGLCLGMQVMVVESARDQLGLAKSNSTEFDSETANPVISLMSDQRDVSEMGGTMRLGNYPCELMPGTRAAKSYGTTPIVERHRHRFEFNNAYRESLQEVGLLASGLSPDGRLVEIVENVDHPFMVGVQFHPEFRSRPQEPHPLFRDFIEASTQVLRPGAQAELPLSDDARR
jgi:CTP synthase